ncbi:MAG: alpha/beta hydrolase [Gemmatimonadota bacterium]
MATYAWGEEGPTVLLVHGWSSHTGHMTGFVDPLLRRGFRVVAFDGPAHGRSPGARTDIFELRPTLVVHDREDEEIPWTEGRRVVERRAGPDSGRPKASATAASSWTRRSRRRPRNFSRLLLRHFHEKEKEHDPGR